jgi:hypothetical protein
VTVNFWRYPRMSLTCRLTVTRARFLTVTRARFLTVTRARFRAGRSWRTLREGGRARGATGPPRPGRWRAGVLAAPEGDIAALKGGGAAQAAGAGLHRVRSRQGGHRGARPPPPPAPYPSPYASPYRTPPHPRRRPPRRAPSRTSPAACRRLRPRRSVDRPPPPSCEAARVCEATSVKAKPALVKLALVKPSSARTTSSTSVDLRDAACPLSTRGGTRLVRLVRGRGGGGKATSVKRGVAGPPRRVPPL